LLKSETDAMGATEEDVRSKRRVSNRAGRQRPPVRGDAEERDRPAPSRLDNGVRDALPDVQPPGRIKRIRPKDVER